MGKVGNTALLNRNLMRKSSTVMNLQQSGRYRSLKGLYKPTHPEKYKGTKAPFFKSKIELMMMRYLDGNVNVLSWTYEPFAIKYKDEAQPIRTPSGGVTYRVRSYYIDFVCVVRMGNTTRKFWIETKATSDVNVGHNSRARDIEKRDFITNMSKWKAASQIAKNQGHTFIVVTEETLKKLVF